MRWNIKKKKLNSSLLGGIYEFEVEVGVTDTVSKDFIFELKVELATRKFHLEKQELKLKTANARFGIITTKLDNIVFWCQD